MRKTCLVALGCSLSGGWVLAQSGAEVAVPLTLGNENSSIRPSFSPKGTMLTLVPEQIEGLKGHDHLLTKVSLREDGQLIVVARSKVGEPYDLIFVDTDLDGSLTDEEPVTAKKPVSEKRGKWWSRFEASFQSSHAAKDSLPAEGDYAVALWAVVEEKEARPDVIRYSGASFYTGSFERDATQYHFYVKDANNDGLVTKDDYWSISAEGIKKRALIRNINDFAWANGKAWKITLGNTQGTQATVVEHFPKVTEQEDLDARNPYKADEELARAAKPLAFEKDYELALARAREEKKPLFIKFETTWCGPCKTMTRLVFSAQNVVDATKGVICLKVDGDERKDLVEKYQIKGYPHLLLLDSEGKELKRAVGYQSAKKTISLIKNAKE